MLDVERLLLQLELAGCVDEAAAAERGRQAQAELRARREAREQRREQQRQQERGVRGEEQEDGVEIEGGQEGPARRRKGQGGGRAGEAEGRGGAEGGGGEAPGGKRSKGKGAGGDGSEGEEDDEEEEDTEGSVYESSFIDDEGAEGEATGEEVQQRREGQGQEGESGEGEEEEQEEEGQQGPNAVTGLAPGRTEVLGARVAGRQGAAGGQRRKDKGTSKDEGQGVQDEQGKQEEAGRPAAPTESGLGAATAAAAAEAKAAAAGDAQAASDGVQRVANAGAEAPDAAPDTDAETNTATEGDTVTESDAPAHEPAPAPQAAASTATEGNAAGSKGADDGAGGSEGEGDDTLLVTRHGVRLRRIGMQRLVPRGQPLATAASEAAGAAGAVAGTQVASGAVEVCRPEGGPMGWPYLCDWLQGAVATRVGSRDVTVELGGATDSQLTHSRQVVPHHRDRVRPACEDPPSSPDHNDTPNRHGDGTAARGHASGLPSPNAAASQQQEGFPAAAAQLDVEALRHGQLVQLRRVDSEGRVWWRPALVLSVSRRYVGERRNAAEEQQQQQVGAAGHVEAERELFRWAEWKDARLREGVDAAVPGRGGASASGLEAVGGPAGASGSAVRPAASTAASSAGKDGRAATGGKGARVARSPQVACEKYGRVMPYKAEYGSASYVDSYGVRRGEVQGVRVLFVRDLLLDLQQRQQQDQQQGEQDGGRAARGGRSARGRGGRRGRGRAGKSQGEDGDELSEDMFRNIVQLWRPKPRDLVRHTVQVGVGGWATVTGRQHHDRCWHLGLAFSAMLSVLRRRRTELLVVCPRTSRLSCSLQLSRETLMGPCAARPLLVWGAEEDEESKEKEERADGSDGGGGKEQKRGQRRSRLAPTTALGWYVVRQDPVLYELGR